MASRASAASACSLRNTTWTRCSRMPTTSSCWCAARSLPPAGPMRCAPTRACARSIWAAAAVRTAAPHARRPRQAEAAMGSEAILEGEGLDAAYGLAQSLFNGSLGEARAPWTPERLYAIFPNLAEMRGRRASQMSGGEQQMLTIARTLMGNPEAVLLDEPSEGLAPVIVEQMAVAVSRMKAEGIAVLLSEQNLHFASAVADRTYIIEKGAIRHEGRMADIAADASLREADLGG